MRKQYFNGSVAPQVYAMAETITQEWSRHWTSKAGVTYFLYSISVTDEVARENWKRYDDHDRVSERKMPRSKKVGPLLAPAQPKQPARAPNP